MLGWDIILTRLLLASLFGALIGLERERRNWTAGLRTHMMVCVGSSLIMIVSAFGFSDILGAEHVALDPSRIAAQVVSGIGFIGAGVILFLKRGTIRGLTTAAGLWTVAAIGLATGGGLYFAAAATTLIALVILWALHPLERTFFKRLKFKTLQIVSDSGIDNTELLRRLMKLEGLKIQTFTFEKEEDDFIFHVKLDKTTTTKIETIVDELKDDPAVKEIFWA